jgi:glycine oxidase
MGNDGDRRGWVYQLLGARYRFPDMMKVAVIGAGVIGLSCAWQLAKADAQVTLFDAQEPPTGASAAAAGWVSATDYARPSQLNRFLMKSVALYPPFVEAVQKDSGIDVGFKKTGHLRLCVPADAHRAFKSDLALTAEVPELLQAFVRAQLAEGTLYRWNEGSYALAPRLLLEALFKAGQGRGVEFVPAEVCDIQNHVIFTADKQYAFDVIVVAGGYVRGWLKDLLGNDCRVRPKRGEAIEVMLPHGLVLPTVLDAPDMYMVPRQLERKLYIGTLDAWVDDAGLNPQGPAELLALASQWLPALKNAEVTGHFAGVRTVPLNEVPIIGQHTENKHIYMALAFGAGGFKSAPLAGQEITRQILGDLLPKNYADFAE